MCSNDKLNLTETKEFYINPTDAINNFAGEKVSLYKINVIPGVDIEEKQETIEFNMSKYKIDLKKQKIFRINQGENKFNFNEKIICVYEYEARKLRRGKIMKILSVETSGTVCAVALTEDNNLIKEEILEDGNTHSVKLMPLIDKLLNETNTNIKDIDLFACDIGPGSFTGIRIGVSTLKAFIDVTNKRAIGVTSLEILIENVKENGIICSLIDAKNSNVYCGIFEKMGDNYKQIDELQFDNINNIINLVKNKKENVIFVGNGSLAHKDMIESQLENAKVLTDLQINVLNARNIGKIAFRKKEQAVDTNHLKPIYLRASNAER